MSHQDTGRNARTYILSLINTMDVAELDRLIGVGLEDRKRRPSLDETRVLEEDRQDDEEDWEPMSKGQLKCTVYSQNEEINSTSVKRKSFGAHAALPAKAIRGLNDFL